MKICDISNKKGDFEERMVPSESRSDLYMAHLNRYSFAFKLLVRLNGHDYHCARRLRVLDAGCGVGYGTAWLNNVANLVVGIDNELGALNLAQHKYKKKNSVFINMDVTMMGFEDQCFDVIVAFEVIEHIKQQYRFLKEVQRILKPKGYFIVSTPFKKDRSSDNPFHVKELNFDDFSALLKSFFPMCEFYAQYRKTNIIAKLLSHIDFKSKLSEKISPFLYKGVFNIAKNTGGFILLAICKKE